jgi:ribonuclease Z
MRGFSLRAVVLGAVVILGLGVGIGYLVGTGQIDISGIVEAAGGTVTSPTGVAPDRYVYYPGTEPLLEDEIRLTACGTGLPAARRGQAASCFLFELGNGDKFLFDLGTGSMANIAAMMIPMDYLTKVFISHLHTDHWGDLAGLWAGGWTAGRTGPLEVWGPSGAREDMGTRYAIEHFMQTYNWDYMTRAAMISPIPGSINVHEFDYKQENQVVYEENGVTVRSFPAIHAGDGPVSYILEWNGYKIVYSGDTMPNSWMIKYAKGADMVIHETMPMPADMVKFYNQPPERGIRASCGFHTCPPAFGKVMSDLKPRIAVAFHWFNEEGTRYNQFAGIRQTYDGPLSMATDNMVWNIRKDEIIERMAVSTDDAWDVEGPGEPNPPDLTRESEYTSDILRGMYDTTAAEKATADAYFKRFGLTPTRYKPEKPGN